MKLAEGEQKGGEERATAFRAFDQGEKCVYEDKMIASCLGCKGLDVFLHLQLQTASVRLLLPPPYASRQDQPK